MNRLELGGWPLVYPTPETMLHYRTGAEEHLRKHFDVKEYTSPHDINEILKCVLNFFESEIDGLLKPYLCRPFFQGVLLQYKVYLEIYKKYMDGTLSGEERKVYEKLIGPSYGRAVKFIVERMVLLKDLDVTEPQQDGFDEVISALFCCAMQVVELSIQSDLTYGVAPLHSSAFIHPPNSQFYLEQFITDKNLKSCMDDFKGRWRTHIASANKVVPAFNDQTSPEYYSQETFGKAMDNDFLKAHGFSFTNAVNALVVPLECVVPPQDGLPIVFESRDRILQLVHTNTGIDKGHIERIFDGVVITSAGIANEGRKFWDPKSESRARRRGIFEVLVKGQRYYSWCRDLLGEALLELESSATYQDIPIEWKDAETEKGVSRLSNLVGKWFEQLVEDEVKKLGFKALSSKVAIGLNKARLKLPGEIDLIAYHEAEKVLIVGECKRVRGGTEPASFYDEIQKFTRGSEPFLGRLNAKADFVKKEMTSVCAALESEWRIEVNPDKFVRMFITRRPSMASCFVNVPCVSLAELITSYKAAGSWPYGVERLSNS